MIAASGSVGQFSEGRYAVTDSVVVITETVNVSLGMCHGDIATVKQQYPQLFTKKLIITQKLGFADVIAPG